jgi:DNA-binding PadR family transcriptional regulator
MVDKMSAQNNLIPKKVSVFESVQAVEREVLVAVASQSNKEKSASEIAKAFNDLHQGERTIDIGTLSSILIRLESKQWIKSNVIETALNPQQSIPLKHFIITGKGRTALVETEELIHQSSTEPNLQSI